MMRMVEKKIVAIVDIILAPFVFIGAVLLKYVRTVGVEQLPWCKAMLLRAGCFPIRDHYHEPAFRNAPISELLSAERALPGIDWNIEEQLQLLSSFSYATELATLSGTKIGGREFYIDNGAFESGDAEYWYSLIRSKKPKRIIEIGSGFSSQVARRALDDNKRVDPHYSCEHILIEPYENDWLESLGVTVIREKVENCDLQMFKELGADDILFIDSSHVIRPQGDVLFEFLGILPVLNNGVIVHIHDIFSPRDYPNAWVVDKVLFWNEQYLLEAFLTSNTEWKVIGAINFLRHHYYEELKEKCPYLTEGREPGSFYIQRIGGES